MRNHTLMVLLAAVFLSGSICLAQSEAVAPLRANEFSDRLYIGFDQIGRAHV